HGGRGRGQPRGTAPAPGGRAGNAGAAGGAETREAGVGPAPPGGLSGRGAPSHPPRGRAASAKEGLPRAVGGPPPHPHPPPPRFLVPRLCLGTSLRETPFPPGGDRRASPRARETEFRGGAFPNSVRERETREENPTASRAAFLLRPDRVQRIPTPQVDAAVGD